MALKVVFTRGALRYAMQTLRGAVSARTTLPILGNVLLDCGAESIEMSATDLEVGVRTRAYGDVETPGVLAVPARKLAEIVRELPDEETTLTVVEGAQVLVECAGVTYRMFGTPPYDFPDIPSIGDDYITLGAPAFLRMLASVRTAVSTDDSKYALNGVYIDLSPDWVRTVATDSRRLAVAQLDVLDKVAARTSFLLPIRAAELAVRAFVETKEIHVSMTEREMVFSDGEITLSGRMVEGSYPAYEQILPTDNPIHAGVHREAFLTAVRRVSLFSDPSTARVQLAIDHDSMELSAHSEEYGDAREEIPVTSSDAITLGFNAEYLTDALTSMDSEQVRVEMKDPLAAAVFRPVDRSDYTHLIMPMRL
jgi:DNA polymerase III subunit beta